MTRLHLLIALAALVAACGTTTDPSTGDGAPEVTIGADTGGGDDDVGGVDVGDDDAAPDVGVDATPEDVAVDTSPDDAAVDAAADTPADTPDDTPGDVPDDAAPDAPVDTAPDVLPDAVDTSADVPMDTAPDVAPDTAPDTSPDVGVDTDGGTGRVCGNAVIEPGELCDGALLGGQSCVRLGYEGGTLRCTDTCDRWDFSGCATACEPVCGARQCGPDPVCGKSCGLCLTGFLCNAEGVCERESTDPVCGDDRRQAGELCDGPDLGAATCETLSFDRGTLACSSDCLSYDTSACERDVVPDPFCGDGTRDAGELCDGADLSGADCTTVGFDVGTLRCQPDCLSYDVSACESVCVPACGGRSCGPDPVCGTSCGTCIDAVCDAGVCIPTSERGPTIVRFNTNVTSITEGFGVRFTAVVTDPDGFDNIAGGTLSDPVSGAFYGPFVTSAGEGTYSLDVTWDEIHRVRSIDFEGEETRTFVAELFDNDGNEVSASTGIRLFCPDAPSGACDGVCRSFDSLTDCGGCGIACDAGGSCVDGACGCGFGLDACDGECVFFDTLEHCTGCNDNCGDGRDATCGAGGCVCEDHAEVCDDGRCGYMYRNSTCGDACTTCGAHEMCTGFRCAVPSDGDVRIANNGTLEVFHDGNWAGVCDDGFGVEDATVACRQLGGELVSFATGQTGRTSMHWMDDLNCWGGETRLEYCDGEIYTSENCSINEYVTLFCERPPPPVECVPGRGTGVTINEVLPNPSGTDGSGETEFVELRGPAGRLVETLSIVGINGNMGFEFLVWDLGSGATIPSNGYLVVGGDLVSNVDIVRYGPIQNGPDSIVLMDCDGTILDAVGYGDFSAAFYAGEGNAAPYPTEGSSVSRTGGDTDDNASDFALRAPTPGAANAP